MKFFLLALLVLTSAIAETASIEAASIGAASPSSQAASAENRYYAARDAYVAKIETITADGNPDNEASKLHERATKELARLVTPIIGPIAIKGFPAKPTSSLDSL
jgi:hypothetical protein